MAMMFVLAISSLASAGAPPAYSPVDTYILVDGEWETPAVGELGTAARAFTSLPESGSCDKRDWVITFVNHVTVSQWISYKFSGTRWDWQIRKPGIFATDGIEMGIQSNDDVNIDFDGFANLVPLIHVGAAADIAVFYAYTQDDGVPSTWYTPDELNSFSGQLSYAQVKDGEAFVLWTKIVIPEDQRACDYEDSWIITLSLTDVKYFIDEETGEYNDLDPGFNPYPPYPPYPAP